MNEIEPLLARWANFYLVMTQAAAALIGLLFVVITLAAERGGAEQEDNAKIRVYLTPTVVYFASVLVVAAVLTFPNHTRLTAAVCVCLLGIGGLVYSGCRIIGDKRGYEELRDIVVYAIFPFAGYALLVLGGALVLRDPKSGLTVAAVGILSLLTIGIRNSWAIAIAVAVSARRGRQ